MSDPYIDQYETLIYGKHACEQMEKVCIGRVPKLDSMVKYAILAQQKANADMAAALEKQPKVKSVEGAAQVLEDARDTIVRFGSYLGSLKGHPVSPADFFRNEKPSDLARRRLVKLAAAVEHIVEEIPKHPAITDPTWLKDFKALSKKLQDLKGTHLEMKVERADLAPEVAAARDAWLVVYNANKLLVRGLLAHAGKTELLPHIFDDLAEVHHLAGVSDAEPPPEGGAAQASPPGASPAEPVAPGAPKPN
jgi:hypothetical protein